MTKVPWLKGGVVETPPLHFFGRPLCGIDMIRRACQARTVKISEDVHRVHDPGILHSLFPNLCVYIGRSLAKRGDREKERVSEN